MGGVSEPEAPPPPSPPRIRPSFEMDLRDGTRVLLRPVRPGDRPRFIEGLALLSMESRYHRFFSPVSELTEEQLRYLTEVDQIDHVAWGAVDPVDPFFPGYGVARFIRVREDPETAEIALAVIDAYQRKGLGSILLAILYLLMGAGGIRFARSTILPANRFLIDWIHDLGAEKRLVEGAYRLVLPVTPDLSSLPDHPRGRRFRMLLEEVRDLLFLPA